MTSDGQETRELLERAGGGDREAAGQLFAQHRERLRRMVELRLDHRLQGRLDASDILQDAYLEFAHSLADYLRNPAAPLYLWLRHLTERRLQWLHRQHLGAKMRDAGREVSLQRGALPQASSVMLAAQFMGRHTSPSQAAVRAELQLRIQDALNSMDPIDREVLALRHFEQLSNLETAQVLGLSETAASNHLGATANWPVWWWDWMECRHFYGEAKRLIDGTAPAEDPRLHVLRARALAGLRASAKADVEYAKALQHLGDQPQIRLEVHRNRGYAHTGSGQWSKAAAEFATAAKLQPDEVRLWFFGAVAHLAAGDLPAYRQTCAAVLERFEKVHDLHSLCYAVRTCVMAEGPLADGLVNGSAQAHLTRLSALSERAAPHGSFGATVRGSALYRAGKYEQAVRCFETMAKDYQPRAWHWCFLAMAHHRLGHTGEARRCLDQAARWIDDANREELDDITATRPAWGNWDERVVFPILFREAEGVLKR